LLIRSKKGVAFSTPVAHIVQNSRRKSNRKIFHYLPHLTQIFLRNIKSVPHLALIRILLCHSTEQKHINRRQEWANGLIKCKYKKWAAKAQNVKDNVCRAVTQRAAKIT
jgi:hypothetical protein